MIAMPEFLLVVVVKVVEVVTEKLDSGL